MHMLTALQDQASMSYRVPERVMYTETIRATEDQFGDQQLAAGATNN
jgi:hypothetical protein